MNLAGLILKLAGWKVTVTLPEYPKCIIAVAPHTSNWDFFLGKLAYASIGRRAGFLMKEAWFFFPLNFILKAIGGIPVPRRRGASLVDSIINKFNQSSRMVIAITPEGTRSRTSEWRHGLFYIARGANIPIQLAAIDYPTKHISITDELTVTGDIDADMVALKKYYSRFTGKYPDKFTTE